MFLLLDRVYRFCLSRPFGIFSLVGLNCYLNALNTPFIFDDIEGIVNNPGIRQLWPLDRVMQVGPDETPWGRPVVAFSLALNFAVSELYVWSYHLFNLFLFVAAATVLFLLIERILSSSPLCNGLCSSRKSLAFISALVWLVHPLSTNVVTYTIQRAESLMLFFYLLTLLCVVMRIHAKSKQWCWTLLAVLACGLGMASKETMVTAPVVAFLLDGWVLGHPLKTILKERWRLYLGLASTWGVLLALMLTWPRSQTVGAGDLSSLEYFMMQWQIIVHYTKLVFWPAALSLDYAWPRVNFEEGWHYGAGLTVLFLGGLWDLFKAKRGWGFYVLFVFIVLSPTSSFIPIQTSTAAEHRMVLPMAALIVWFVCCVYLVLKHWFSDKKQLVGVATVLTLLGTVGLGMLTVSRNQDYRTAATMWQDVVEKQPLSDRAWNNLGGTLFLEGRKAEAEPCFRKAIELNPDYAESIANLGVILGQRGELAESIELLKRAIELEPNYLQAYINLGLMTYEAGRLQEAIQSYVQALEIAPGHPQVNYNLAHILTELHRYGEALQFVTRTLQVQPDYPNARELEQILRNRTGF